MKASVNSISHFICEIYLLTLFVSLFTVILKDLTINSSSHNFALICQKTEISINIMETLTSSNMAWIKTFTFFAICCLYIISTTVSTIPFTSTIVVFIITPIITFPVRTGRILNGCRKGLKNITSRYGDHEKNIKFITRGLRPRVINLIFSSDYHTYEWYFLILFDSR